MRDAFGGTFMIKLLIVFIVIYVGFTAVALNYAKAFKAKNIVIEYLENNEVSSINDNKLSAATRKAMEDYFAEKIAGDLNYIYPNACKDTNSKTICFNDLGIKIEQMEPYNADRNKIGVYYRVTTYFGFKLPFFNRLLALNGESSDDDIIGTWKIVGETRTIAYE